MTLSVNVSRVIASLGKKRDQLARGFQRGILAAGRELLKASQEVVPIDTQTLYDTGSAYNKMGSGFRSVVWVSYATEYAVIVHEVHHFAHGSAFNAKHAAEIAAGLTHSRRPLEQWKFLEMPLRRDLNSLVNTIIVEMAR